MTDVPRNRNGWPTIEPKFFTEEQLRKEAENWRPVAKRADGYKTVGYHEWNKYATELYTRGFTGPPDLDRVLIECHP